MKLGFAGPDLTGRTTAMNLLRAGGELVVNDCNDRRFEASRQAGALATRDLAGLTDAEVVFLCPSCAKVVQPILLGEQVRSRPAPAEGAAA